MRALPGPLEAVDVRITQWMARYGVVTLRVALGLVFLWFGVLKARLSRYKIPHTYSQPQYLGLTSMRRTGGVLFPRPGRLGLYRIVQTNFGEFPFHALG
jgi:hypothetical protein